MRPVPSTKTAAEPATMPSAWQRGHVLVVDDEPDIPELLERLLSSRGWTVSKARSGPEALAMLEAKSIDLLVTDLRMPGMGGLELIERARAEAPHCGSVLITGYASTETAIEALRRGADDYLPKPFSATDLEHVLERVLAARRLTRDQAVASHRIRAEAETLKRQRFAVQEDLARTRSDLTTAQRDHDRRTRDLTFVSQIAALLAREPDLDRVLRRLTQILAERFEAAVVRIELDLGDGIELAETGGSSSGPRLAGLGGELTRAAASRPDDVYMDVVLGGGAPLDALAAVVRRAGRPIGGLSLLRRPQEPADPEGDRYLMRLVPQTLAVAVEAEFQRRTARKAALDVAGRIVEALEERGSLFAGRAERTARIAASMADAAGLSKRSADVIRTAARLQDVGKVSLPDATLQKSGPLTDAERSLLHRHPVVGERILAPFAEAAFLVRSHCERPDGAGYPDGIDGGDIPLAAGIVGLAGAFEAMTSARPYRKSLTRREALEEARRGYGKQFVPEAVDALLLASSRGL